MSSGKTVRLGRLMRADKKTLIAALDHGISGLSPLEGLERPSNLISELAGAGMDAIIVTPGILLRFPELFGKIGIVVRVDCGSTAVTGEWSENQPVFSAEDAVRMGADAVIAMGIVGAEGEAASLRALAKLAGECDRWGVPLVAEMLPGGFAATQCSPKAICSAARLGAELGADLIKIRYSGSEESFRAVTRVCFRPVLVLGGSKQDPEELISSTRAAIAAGAAGVAVGRNIWQSREPVRIAARLAEAVHG
jgi:DhnA family fructose-bisphosphate aldolase class Ia